MSDKEKKQQPEDEIVDGEVIAEFTGETFMNLPTVLDDRDRAQDTSRRDFVLRMLVGGTAALALGGSAALLYTQRQQQVTARPVILPYGSQAGDANVPANVADMVQQVADLQYQLAATTAERDQALSDLNTTSTQLQEAQAQLELALAQLEEASGLNSLWQSLDDIGLDTLLRTALDAANAAFTNYLSVLGLLQLGLSQGKAALQGFIAALPGPKQGVRWLQQRVTQLTSDLDWLADMVQEAVAPAQSFTTLIAQFVIWVLDRLPFGAGDQAKAGLEAMRTVINSLPALVEGINNSVLNPLAQWFSDSTENSLAAILLDPIEEKVITPAENTLARFGEFRTVFEDTLAAPAENALEQRAAIRQEIQAAQARLGWRS